MAAEHNVPEIVSWLESFQSDVLDFREDGLGEKVLEKIAAMVQDRTIHGQVSPDGRPLAPNQPDYAARKGYRPVGVGFTEQMLDLEQLKGEQTIEKASAEMEYGQDAENRRKAVWFTEGVDSRNQPARPFYDTDPNIEVAVYALLQAEIDRRTEKFSE